MIGLYSTMASRRQEKVARVVKEVVSDAIANHLSDPRITGLVSVTKVDMTPDLRNANVFVSIFGGNPADQSKTFAAITHAKSRIQALLAGALHSRFCPVLHIYQDETFKKTLETMRLIDEAAKEYEKDDSDDDDEPVT